MASVRDLTDPAAVLAELIRCPSVTPAEGGALSALGRMLNELGFDVMRPVFSDKDTPDVENLFAARGAGPHLCFAGHTDVVPVGDESEWSLPPFSAEIRDGELYGRGAVDMKGGIAAFVAALARRRTRGERSDGRVSLLITGDEEGPAINGTIKLLDWIAARGERLDACLVGEPTNPETLGDMVKIGRRGSLSAHVTVTGRQGHVAYPHLADNPLRTITAIAEALQAKPFDKGTEAFPPTNLEITSIDTGNDATNVIPGRARLSFNVRFCDLWTPDSLKAELLARVETARNGSKYRAGKEPAEVSFAWRGRPSEAFLTRSEDLISALSGAVAAVTGKAPRLSTTGGTSDARFIKDFCPVVEFGLVGQTMHMIDEHVALADLEALTEIYDRFISRWFAANPASRV
ncbi:succinyl-diaminopimelate desuccinylase [Fulvimarina pelagi HTCC2506]|uniref:Succinyl-diaminopimelate desuccinylase n=2 Tax=Fulvimarina pelagi TaxID=217511 RepID=Q0G187_9HYPH|nr:succinyl-diaminopimelate desuccinylase [Fulvimarina pelagi]EAU41194.1 succinyl-diaminopimelate desuccinylase [Fulvimarina pelagi HTCC2506]BAT30795.1 succinyl-diaminopimelate desuccinylase [Fulvimarina pelagi]